MTPTKHTTITPEGTKHKLNKLMFEAASKQHPHIVDSALAFFNETPAKTPKGQERQRNRFFVKWLQLNNKYVYDRLLVDAHAVIDFDNADPFSTMIGAGPTTASDKYKRVRQLKHRMMGAAIEAGFKPVRCGNYTVRLEVPPFITPRSLPGVKR